MPIRIPNNLPARGVLEGENIFVMSESRAESQQIRPLRIGLLNLMPTKITTETQLSRLLGNTLCRWSCSSSRFPPTSPRIRPRSI